MTDILKDAGYKVATWLVNLICQHPAVVGWFIVVFVVATLVNTGIKGTWTYAEMPRWARFVLAFTMPLALNFWFLGKKVGLQEPGPLAESIRNAEKQP